MTDNGKICEYNMQMTLEKHFENFAQTFPAVKEIHSLWTLFKKRMEDELLNSRSVFANYSLHDGNHSRSIIQAIERFLGEERICRLSATDTFMLLACAYAHDYGMAQTFNKLYDILGSSRFESFLEDSKKELSSLEREEAWAVNNLLHYLNQKKADIPLNDIYYSIILVIQLYLRPNHWKGITDIRKNFEGLFSGQMKNRFLSGREGIVEICMCHGQSIKELLRLSKLADGMAGDDYHPRFIAAMLRLGDLLDLDNGRFPSWFVSQIARNKNVIPQLSVRHLKKHEAVSHLLITPEKIEVTAHCWSEEIDGTDKKNIRKREFEAEKAQEECYEIAGLISEWTQQLSNECRELVLHWDEITQPDFGRPPARVETSIYVDGKEYIAENRTLQMKMSQERIMDLLEGTSIYRDRYVGIRELIQNAIDATLLQFWNDFTQNRYASYGLFQRDDAKPDLLDFLDKKKASVFGNYDIKVEVMEDRLRKQVFIIVKDKGIGITEEEVKYIADIGSNKDKNSRTHKLSETMPAWLKPSGIFGIGLQSVFQLTDRLDFYTRQHNLPERQITLYSYGKSRGKIVARDLPDNTGGLYYDNTIPGTNVKIAINPGKLFGNRNGRKNHLHYYDTDFDTEETMDLIFKEVSRACIHIIEENPYDYFNIRFETKILSEDGIPLEKTPYMHEHRRKSYIYSGSGEEINQVREEEIPESFEAIASEVEGSGEKNAEAIKDGFYFKKNMAFYWDKRTYRCYRMTMKPCTIRKENFVYLPPKVQNLYKVNYKFNKISNMESIYEEDGTGGWRPHAGFFELELEILDDHPEKYMNIDRDRLRDGAIKEKELERVYQKILQYWCGYFCEGKQEAELEREMLCSFFVIFYKNVPPELFEKFKKRYGKQIQDLQIVLGKEESIGFYQLFGAGTDCEISFALPEKCSPETVKDIAGNLKKQNIYRFPHRLLHIREIKEQNKESARVLSYKMLFCKTDEALPKIEMDDTARLYDYCMALDEVEEDDYGRDYASLVKKVFKPDARYEKLLVPCFPRTFRKGENMRAGLDYCIKGYILSPFDKDACRGLKRVIRKEKAAAELIEEILESRQLEKCVSYIRKKRDDGCNSRKEEIKEQYRQFLSHFIELLQK